MIDPPIGYSDSPETRVSSPVNKVNYFKYNKKKKVILSSIKDSRFKIYVFTLLHLKLNNF